jgi:cysteine desulfurase
MDPWLKNKFGNAASRNHPYGWEAEEGVEISREHVASIIGAIPKEIIFTSGATEANNIALQGAARYYMEKGRHIITLKTEHKAVLDICDYLEKGGFEITRLPLQKDGLVDIDKFECSIRPDTIMVSIMHANNEIGVIQPTLEIGHICKKKNIIFHVDAAQSVGKIPVDINRMGIDLLSISAHKIYGPKGVGALYLRRKDPRVQLQPIMYGGGHEQGIRSGTLPVSSIVGFGKACEISQNIMAEESEKILGLRNTLIRMIQKNIPTANVNGSMEKRLPGNLNMSFPGANNETIIAGVPEIAISSGSACTSSTMEASHVLLALGLSKNEAYSALRFGIGRFNTKEDIEIAANSISRCMQKLTKMSYE